MKRPVMLVHGFLATEHMMWPIGARLKRRGFEVAYAKLSPLCLPDVRVLAQQLSDSVEAACERYGVPEIDLVGLSQGGLTSLAYLRWFGGAIRVRRAVFVAAPLHGTSAARAGVPVLGCVSDGIWQMLPNARVLGQLTAAPVADVEVSTLSVHGDPVAPPATCAWRFADNHSLRLRAGPLNHQWIGFSTTALSAIVERLTLPGRASPRE